MFGNLFPGGDVLMAVRLIAGLVLLMVMTTADGGRVLNGSAQEGLTIKQIGQLNRFNMPGRAMDLVVNVVLILFLGQAMAVIVARIMGYLLCHILSPTGFLRLRKDSPHLPRPIRLASQSTYVATALVIIDVAMLVVEAASASITGYGSTKELIIGVVVLSISIGHYAYRRVDQDGKPWAWRETDEPPAPRTRAAV